MPIKHYKNYKFYRNYLNLNEINLKLWVIQIVYWNYIKHYLIINKLSLK